MKNLTLKTLVILTCFFGLNATGQNELKEQLNSAQKYFDAYEYPLAIKSYKKALVIDNANITALDGLIEIYLYRYELWDSAYTYIDKRLRVPTEDTNYVHYYNFANCQRLREEHESAIEYYQFFKKYGIKNRKKANDLINQIDQYIHFCQNALKSEDQEEVPYDVENMGFFINSVDPEYTPVYLESQQILLYNARYKDHDKELLSHDESYFENIYYFDLDESSASTYNPGIDQTSHQAVVSKNPQSDSIIIFYQNRLWISTMGEDRLNQLSPLPDVFNTFYFQPHGVFSKDHKTFIFSARSKEGNLDIYWSKFNGSGWTIPSSISARINSAEDEDAPYLSADDSKLYFSSKGHDSRGGYDFFVSEYVDGAWTNPVNLGYPMNSAGDDIYISFDRDEKGGYFSSNRVGGFGCMDIYQFSLSQKTIRGTVKDMAGNLLPGVTTVIQDLETGEIFTVETDEKGDYSLLVEPERRFIIKGTKKGYFDDSNSIETLGEEDVFIVNLSLEKDPGLSLFILITDSETGEAIDSVKIKLTDNMTNGSKDYLTKEDGSVIRPLPDKKLNERGSYNLKLERKGYLAKTVTYNVLFDREGKFNVHESLDLSMEKADLGQDLSKIIDLQPIYFDVGRYNIRKDAAIELDKIVQVMNDNPTMRIELGSHTDARGSAASNQKLSEKRAKSSAEYIQARISNPERVSYKGYGEAQPVNECSDGVECSEEKHQENRRTEFIILEM